MTNPVDVIDFSRSYCYYVPVGHTIWVRIQTECRCEVFDRTTGASDEYNLGIRVQTGLRTNPVDHAVDPGYDFWMIFSKKHVFIRRGHTSSSANNPTKVPVENFIETGWHVRRTAGRRLTTAAEVLDALKRGLRITARTEFSGSDPNVGYRIEYPVRWADGDPVKDNFRVETGPVLLMDPDKHRPGLVPEFDDFRWTYLDYHNFTDMRCLQERRTSIFTGATYPGSTDGSRIHPPLTEEQCDRIKARLFTGWEPPVPLDQLERLFETEHYSEANYYPAQTELYAFIEDE